MAIARLMATSSLAWSQWTKTQSLHEVGERSAQVIILWNNSMIIDMILQIKSYG